MNGAWQHLDTTMTKTTKTILAALAGLLLSSLAACDPCAVGYQINIERCSNGDQASCDWIADNFHGAQCDL